MNSVPFYENFLGRHFPGIAARRSEARARSTIMNSVSGGVPTRTSETWPRRQGLAYGTSTDRAYQASAIDRAYEAYEKNPVARTLVQTECDNVIGDGLNYQPTSSSPDWNREAEDKYYEWLEDCSVRGADVQTGVELQRSLWSNSRVGGDVGWILTTNDTADRLESRIQPVLAMNIASPPAPLADRTIYDGIRYSAVGRPIEYFHYTTDELSKRKFTAIPARDFVFFPHMTGVMQGRGETCFITIFDLLANLDRYVDSVSLAAWMATVFGLIIKSPNAAQEVTAITNTVTNAAGNQQKALQLERSGFIKYLGEDGDVVQVDAKQPMQQTPDFIDAMFRMLGQPFDMPLEVIAKNMAKCTFASARIGLLPFYRSCRIKASRFGSRWSRTIRWWSSREAQRTRSDPKRWKTKFPDDYWNHELLPNAWDYTDPVSEAQSDHLQMDMGTKSPQMVIAERGRDVAKILRERREWAEKTKDLPAVNSTMTRHPQSGVGATGDPLGKEAVEPPQQQPAPNNDNADEENQNANNERNGDGELATPSRI